MTFQERYQQTFGIKDEDYARHLLRRCLTWQARLFGPFLSVFDFNLYTADYDLMHDVGLLKSPRGLSLVINAWIHHPENRKFARRRMRVRVSKTKLKAVIREIVGAESGDHSRDAVIFDSRPPIPMPRFQGLRRDLRPRPSVLSMRGY